MADAPELFDKFGRFDVSGFTPEIIEATMNEDQQAAFFECIEACKATDDAEARERASVILVREKMQAQAVALDLHIKSNPGQSRIEAMREVIAAQSGTPQKAAPKSSHPKIAHKGPRLAYEKSELELTAARVQMYAAQSDVRRWRPVSADALTKFMGTFKQKSTMDLHREVIAGQQAERMRRVAAGLTPEYVAPVVTNPWPCQNGIATNGKPKKPQVYIPRR